MSRVFTVDTKPYDDCRIYNRKNITVETGLTVLVGCNGAGKSTLLSYIKNDLDKNDIPVFMYDNVHDGGSRSTSNAIFRNQISLAATLFCSSEGEKINLNIQQIAGQLGQFIRQNQDKHEIWMLFDAIDSGFSIDNIQETKNNLFTTIISYCESRGIDIYIVVSANSYEMANGERCMDVWDGKYVRFNNYDEYKGFILKTRKRKDKRCGNR